MKEALFRFVQDNPNGTLEGDIRDAKHWLKAFVKEVITGEKTFDELVRDFGLEED